MNILEYSKNCGINFNHNLKGEITMMSQIEFDTLQQEAIATSKRFSKLVWKAGTRKPYKKIDWLCYGLQYCCQNGFAIIQQWKEHPVNNGGI